MYEITLVQSDVLQLLHYFCTRLDTLFDNLLYCYYVL